MSLTKMFKHILDIKENICKTFFEHLLSSKMGRGVLAVRAARAGAHFGSQNGSELTLERPRIPNVVQETCFLTELFFEQRKT